MRKNWTLVAWIKLILAEAVIITVIAVSNCSHSQTEQNDVLKVTSIQNMILI